MTSVADTDEGMQKLWAAIGSLNIKLKSDSKLKLDIKLTAGPTSTAAYGQDSIPEMVIPPRQAARQETELIPWENAAGRISGEVIATYPPGIALVAPGERIPKGLPELASQIRVMC